MQGKLSKWLQISDLKSLSDVVRINTSPASPLSWQTMEHDNGKVFGVCLSHSNSTLMGLEDSQISLGERKDLNFPRFISTQFVI